MDIESGIRNPKEMRRSAEREAYMHETEGWDNQQVLQELANKIEEYGHAVQEETSDYPGGPGPEVAETIEDQLDIIRKLLAVRLGLK